MFNKIFKKYVIGIPSYFPDDKYEIRAQKLERNLDKLYELFPSFPVVIIAQNWKEDYMPKHNPDQEIHVYRFEKLGIIGARKKLEEVLHDIEFDYAILCDDDAIIYGDKEKVSRFLAPFENRRNGFTFREKNIHNHRSVERYFPAPLALCVISKTLLEREPLDPRFDPEQNIAYEDMIYPCILRNKYPQYEVQYPLRSIFTSFTTDFVKAESTWFENADSTETASGEAPQAQRWKNTVIICDYIDRYKKYPEFTIEQGKIIIKDGGNE
jgi:hypothetical protein